MRGPVIRTVTGIGASSKRVDSGNTEGNPREFVYLNDESVNGHLSSSQIGIPTERRETSKDETEIRGQVSAMLDAVQVGVRSEGRQIDAESTEILRQLTAPYGFEKLREISEIQDPTTDDFSPEKLRYGDIVEVSGTVEPMSLLRMELNEGGNLTMQKATLKMVDAMTNVERAESSRGQRAIINAAQKISKAIGSSANLQRARADVAEVAVEVSKMLNGERAPLRIDSEGYSFGVALDRDYIRGPIRHAFSGPRKYTVFGRVESKVPSDEEWDPIDTVRSVSALSEDLDTGELREGLSTFAEEQGIILDSRHETVVGPAIILHPIAIYW